MLSSSILSISGSAKRKVLAVAIGEMGTARKESIVRLLSLDPDRPGSVQPLDANPKRPRRTDMQRSGAARLLPVCPGAQDHHPNRLDV